MTQKRLRLIQIHLQEGLAANTRELPRLVRQMLKGRKRWPNYLIDFYLVDGPAIRRIKRKYFDQRRYTDVISLNYTTLPGYLEGVVFICLPVAQQQATELGIPLRQELLRLASHGVLHLLGFTDETAAQRQRMRTLENRALSQLSKKNA